MKLGLARTRLVVSLVAGALAGALVGTVASWQLAVLVGWIVTAGVMVVWVLSALLPLDGAGTAAIATREDNSRILADVSLVSACVASLVGVGFALVKSNSEEGAAAAVLTAAAVATVVLSWTVVHTVYMLRYARLYFAEGGGIGFNGDDDPDYRDFAYLAFTIGMTYQVSDTDLSTKPIRRTATHHALLSYLFGTVVVAMTINVVASLVK